MNVGIKGGPLNFPDVFEESGASYAEIYFDYGKKDQHREIFSYLRKKKIRFGLHFWASIFGKYSPNLTYPHSGIADETARLLKKTIDVAQQEGAFYVNTHPESLRAVELDLEKQEYRVANLPEISEDVGFSSLLRHGTILREYAKKRKVDFYIETVPFYDPSNFRQDDWLNGRLSPIDKLGMSTKKLIELSEMGFDICFDIAHCCNQYPNEPRDQVFQKVLDEARALAPYTKLIHVSTTIPPLNGTDSHNGILASDFALNVYPDKKQLVKILNVFKDYNDILCIPEPQIEKMVENYFELKKIIEEL